MARFWKPLLFVFLVVVFAIGVWLYIRIKLPASSDKPEISLADLKNEAPPEPGEPAQVVFLEPNLTCPERQAFLAENYKPLRRVNELPVGILRLYTVKGETRIAMADPGGKFEETDVVSDPRLPSRRLIFAGVAQDRAFVHYEEGGIGKFFVVEFFRLKSPETAVGVWRGFCNGSAQNLDELRRVLDRNCK
jgi:hypothetical protein